MADTAYQVLFLFGLTCMYMYVNICTYIYIYIYIIYDFLHAIVHSIPCPPLPLTGCDATVSMAKAEHQPLAALAAGQGIILSYQ